MTRLIMAALTLTLLTGVAAADRRGKHRDRDNRPVARDNRGHGPRTNPPRTAAIVA